MNLIEWMGRGFSKIPIIGGWSRTTSNDRREALRELRRSLLISTSPIWGGAFILFIDKVANSSFSKMMIWECFKTIIKNGELFIYSASTLAPVMYIVTRDRDNVRSFPSKHIFIDIVIMFTVIAAMIFTFQRLKPQTFPDIIIYISIAMYAMAIVVYFFALVYNNTFLANPGKMMRDGENDYLKRLSARRS